MSKGNGQSFSELKQLTEQIIAEFSRTVNKYRDIEATYEVKEAYELLMEHNLASQVEAAAHCEGHRVFSKEGRLQLDNVLKSENDVYVITVPPYTFVLGKILNKWLIIDSHVISEDLSGNGKWDSQSVRRCSNC